jgi:regulatory protein
MSDAYEDGLRLLARRSLTRREIETRLASRGHDPGDVAAAVSRLEEGGLVDDRKLAHSWIEGQAAAKGRGRERALAELEARGVDPAIAAAAWSAAIEEGAMASGELVAKAVRRRLGAAPGRADSGRLARVYNALLSEGFAHEEVASALAPYGFEGIDR